VLTGRQFDVLSSTGYGFRAGGLTYHEVRFVNSLNQFIVPYTKYPSSKDRIDPDTVWHYQVDLSSQSVKEAAALTIARYAIYITTSGIFLIFRLLVTWFSTYPYVSLQCIFTFGEIGRWLAALAQESSIMTYSLCYKGVHTWAFPGDKAKPMKKQQQTDFRDAVLTKLGYHFPAALILWVFAKGIWPILNWFATSLGPGLFSRFQFPLEESYSGENSASILAKIYDEDLVEDKLLYVIRFDHVSVDILGQLRGTLFAERGYRTIGGGILLVLSPIWILLPCLFTIWRPSGIFAMLLLAEQISANIIKLYDWIDLSINTKIGPAREVRSGKFKTEVTGDRVKLGEPSGVVGIEEA